MPVARRVVTIGLWWMLAAPTTIALRRDTPRELIRYKDSRVSMACAYQIVAYGNDLQQLRIVVERAFDEIDRIDRLMSHYKPDSPLSRLNRQAAQGPMKIEPELFDFIAECLRYSSVSNGAFDITVGSLMKAWGFFRGEGRMPSDQELSVARRTVGYQHVILNAEEQTIYFDQPGVELDLGGIAKGYAVDRAVGVLRLGNISRALVSAGGSTIYGLGSPPREAGWTVKIQDPVAPDKTALTVRLKDQALSVSGSYEKFFELGGHRYSHIMDPRTGRPVEGTLGVAVITDNGTAGDALDNVFYVQGAVWSRKSLAAFPVSAVIFFLSETGRKWRMETLQRTSLHRR
ncbi:MAG: FAD:protein FMN transferase [Acidobacteriota bacterium]